MTSPSPQQWVILVALALVGAAALFAGRRRRPLDAPPRDDSHQMNVANKRSAEIRDDMERLLGELSRLSDSIDKQLDGKLEELKSAARDADQRISALRILVQASRPAAQGTVATTPTAIDTPDPRAEKIYRLADEGLAPLQIAQRLNERVGEVELILNLRGAGEHAS
jgi:MYXO-CTERM domain-containing protein